MRLDFLILKWHANPVSAVHTVIAYFCRYSLTQTVLITKFQYVLQVFQQLEGDRIGMLRCSLWDHCNLFSTQCVKDDEVGSFYSIREINDLVTISGEMGSFRYYDGNKR